MAKEEDCKMPGIVPEQVPILLDTDLLVLYFNEESWKNLADYLEFVFQIPTTKAGKQKSLCVTKATVELLSKVVYQVVEISSRHENKQNEKVKNLAKIVFKCLRNAAALSSINQNLICHDLEIIQNSFEIVDNYVLSDDPSDKGITEMWMQFLVNVVVNNLETGKKIWHIFFDYRSRFALHIHSEYQYYTCALLYNILKSGDVDETTYNEIFSMFTTILYSKVDNEENEYLDFIIEHYLRSEYLVDHYNRVCKAETKIFKVLRDILWNDCDKDKDIVSLGFLRLLVDQFNKDSDIILTTAKTGEMEPLTVTLICDILAAISCYEKYLTVMQERKSLLINCLFLLKSMNDLGKEWKNWFTPIEKLSEITEPDEKILDHPAFGFKANLIRIIGNLCWKQKRMQDQVKELEGIALILDSCNMDARNPFIMQWAILAIRNICEDNYDCQAVIAGLNQQSTINSELLKEMGISVENDGKNKIKIVPVDVDTLDVNKKLNSLNLYREK